MDIIFDIMPTLLYSADMYIFFYVIFNDKRRFNYNFIFGIFIIWGVEMLQNIIVLPLSGDVSMKATVMRVSHSFTFIYCHNHIKIIYIYFLCDNYYAMRKYVIFNYKSLSCNKY